MINTVLQVFKTELEKLGINYSYMMNESEKVTYPYVTGEFSENDWTHENLMASGNMLLEAWTRNTWAELTELTEKIKAHFSEFQTIQNGVAVAINYTTAMPRRTNDIELKKMEIQLDCVYWKGI